MKMTNALEYKIQEIVERIKELRAIEGITEEEMAARMGMEAEEYRAYERGEEELNFGFLYTCAQIFSVDVGELIEGVNDSKKLSEKKREALFEVIKERSRAYSVAFASVEELESMNILNATMRAMRRAVEGLSIPADYAMIDGNRLPELSIDAECIVKGDARSMSIACASILAKVSRDRLLYEYAKEYPQYHFDKHKGYGTKAHVEALREFGPCPYHRMSFLGKILNEK